MELTELVEQLDREYDRLPGLIYDVRDRGLWREAMRLERHAEEMLRLIAGLREVARLEAAA